MGLDAFYEINQFVAKFAAAALFLKRCGDVDRHECGIQPSSLGTGEIEVALLGLDRDVFHMLFQSIGEIDVSVDHEDLLGKAGCLGPIVHFHGNRFGG